MTSQEPLRFGTRRSTMAMTQTQGLADQVTRATGRPVKLVPVTSEGDVTTAHLAQLGGTGVFTSALQEELRSGGLDCAVHSLKDLPTAPAPGLFLAAIPTRDDPRDALCARDGLRFAELPAGARVGTGSPRRVAQLAALRPDLHYVAIRGNAESRLGKVSAGDLDAVVLAYAGLRRVGRADAATEVFATERVLPAPGQGALAVECLHGAPAAQVVAAVDDPPTRAQVEAERAVLAALEAGCAAPVGAMARLDQGTLKLSAAVVATDGSAAVRREAETSWDKEDGAQAVRLGRELAAEMIALGADRIVADSRSGE